MDGAGRALARMRGMRGLVRKIKLIFEQIPRSRDSEAPRRVVTSDGYFVGKIAYADGAVRLVTGVRHKKSGWFQICFQVDRSGLLLMSHQIIDLI